MPRLFDSFIAIEMVVLWILEFALCFLIFYIILLPGDAAIVAASGGLLGLHVPTAGHAGVLAATVGAISTVIGMYRPEICLQTRHLLVNSVVAGMLVFPAILLLSAVTDLDPSFILGEDALWPMKILLSWLLLLFSTRLCFRVLLRSGLLNRRVLIVGHGPDAQRTEAAIGAMRRGFFSLAEVIEPSRAASLVSERLRAQRIWGVVVTAEAAAAPDVQHLYAMAGKRGLRLFGDVAFRERQLRRLDLDHLAPDWLTGADVAPTGPRSRAVSVMVRRMTDVAISLGVLAFSLPVMVLAAVLVRLDSPGPVFYRQERVGLGGRRFILFKFRSMVDNAEKHGPAWAVKSDPRVTRVGALMRLTRVDELPQLLNVLRGEMSIVGPRPERPHFVEQFNASIPFYADRARIKPGITGWAQVNYPYGASVEDARQKLAYDLYYMKHRSLWLDVLTLVATVRVILFQEGAR